MGTGRSTSLIRSQGAGAAPPSYVHGTNNKYRRRYMNVLRRSVVDRGTEYHGKEVSINKSLGSNRNMHKQRDEKKSLTGTQEDL